MKSVGQHYHYNGICTAYGKGEDACVRPAPMNMEAGDVDHFCHIHQPMVRPEMAKRLKALFNLMAHRLGQPQGPEFESVLEQARLEIVEVEG